MTIIFIGYAVGLFTVSAREMNPLIAKWQQGGKINFIIIAQKLICLLCLS